MAILLAGEGNVGSVTRSLNRLALEEGLEVVDASMDALTTYILFGGGYFENSLQAAYNPMPWALHGEVGEKVRMVAATFDGFNNYREFIE